MAMRETLQARKAALFLHGLPPSARQEVVARLDAAHSSRLKPLLEELGMLGVSPALGYKLRDLATSDAEASAAHERAMRLGAHDVERALEHCSPATAAHVLRAADWPWKADVLSRMADSRRSRVLERLRTGAAPLAPAVMQTLIEQLCLHAAQRVDVHSKTGTPSVGLSRLLRRWFGWTR